LALAFAAEILFQLHHKMDTALGLKKVIKGQLTHEVCSLSFLFYLNGWK